MLSLISLRAVALLLHGCLAVGLPTSFAADKARGIRENASASAAEPAVANQWIRLPLDGPLTSVAAASGVILAGGGYWGGCSGCTNPPGGLFRSVDGGISWTDVFPGLGTDAVAFAPSNHSVAYASRPGPGLSVWKSADAGITWSPTTLTGNPVRILKVDRSSALGVWAGGASGLFHSSDGGATWAKVLDQTVTALEVSSDPQTVYAGVRFSLSGYSFVLRTRDGGATWTQIRQGGGSTVMTALATEFANPYRVVATTTFYCPSGLPPCTGSALYSSQDGGDTWLQRTVSSRNFSLGTPWLVSAPGTFYVASLQTLAHSEDGGSTWSNLNVTTPGTDIGYFEPYDFAVDQSDSSKVYVLNPVGLFVLRAEPALLSMGHGRFEARLTWRTSSGGGHGAGTLLTNDTGAFSFFTPNNLDLAIKVLDGRPSNGHFWVFGAALTDVEYDLEITDTTNGAVWRHHNPQGTLASYADTSAF